MKKYAFYSVLLLFIFIVSCRDSNEGVENKSTCYITKFNKTIFPNLNNQMFYLSEFQYNENRIIKKMDYTVVQSGTQYILQEFSTIDVVYDSKNQPVKIIEPIGDNNTQYIDELTYDSSGKLIVKDRIFKQLSLNTSSHSVFSYTYNSQNKVIAIEGKLYDRLGNLAATQIENLEYENGNLVKVEKKWTSKTQDFYQITITTYENYDDKPNPYSYINVPFQYLEYSRYSKNNYRKMTKNVTVSDGSFSSSTETYTYTYNENGYLNYFEYKCN